MTRETLRASFNGADSYLTYRFTIYLSLAPPLEAPQSSLFFATRDGSTLYATRGETGISTIEARSQCFHLIRYDPK